MKVILSLVVIILVANIVSRIRHKPDNKDIELEHWKHTCEMLTAVMENSERVMRNNELDISADIIQRALLDAKKPV